MYDNLADPADVLEAAHEEDWQDHLDYDDAELVLGSPEKPLSGSQALAKEYGIAPIAKKNELPFKIVKITASFAQKKQIRQFEPVEIFMSAEAEISSNDRVEIRKAQRALFKQTQKMVTELTKKLDASRL